MCVNLLEEVKIAIIVFDIDICKLNWFNIGCFECGVCGKKTYI